MEVALIGAVMALILLLHGPMPAAVEPQPEIPAPMIMTEEPKLAQEIVIVLPDADGHVGTVVVERGEQRIVLNEAYATSRITPEGEMRFEKSLEPEVRASFERVVTALPARPLAFRLYFARGSDALTEPSRLERDRMLDEVRKRTTPEIVVVGHTDRVGKDEANDELSLARAERVKSDLMAHGISEERIRTAGRGEREPIVPTADGVDEPRNRRVEISVR